MITQHIPLQSALNFSKYDLKANRRGAFSAEQRDIIELLGDIPRAERRSVPAALRARTTTQSMPQILNLTGTVTTASQTRFVPGSKTRAGYFTETFYLIVRGTETNIELPISQHAMSAFEPNRRYTVYYYLNRETPTLLSVDAAE